VRILLDNLCHGLVKGLCSQVVEVVLPPERPARERWLTRLEAARLILSAWRYREIQKGKPTERRSRRHIAKFILVALYTGTRASAVCGAALQPTTGRGWIDVERGVFYRRPGGRLETKKRQSPVPLPPGLLAHLRRWKRQGQAFAVEWNREPVTAVKKAFANVVGDAGVGPECNAACAPAYRGHKVDAGRSRYMGGGGIRGDDGRDAIAALRASSSGALGAG